MAYKIIPHSKPTLGEKEEEAIVSVIRSSQITQDRMVERFEQKFADYIGMKFGVAVNCGLSALHLALISLNVGRGDEVIVPSYVCEALLNAVCYLNAKPIVVDVKLEDGNIDPIAIERKISKKTKAIIIPHIFGLPADMDNIMKFGIPAIEDCAHSIGTIYKGKKVGSLGKISIFSFYATKVLTTGEGGMLLTNDIRIARNVRDLRDYTGKDNFRIRYNYKMTDIAAAMGVIQLSKLEMFIGKRQKTARRYNEIFEGNDRLIIPNMNFETGTKPIFYRYVIRLINYEVEKVIEKMKKKGIICGRGVLNPLHRLLSLKNKNFKNTEILWKSLISLPIYPSLTGEDVLYISKSFLNVIRDY